MPKAFDKSPGKIVYPPNCKEISDELTTDELVRRLKILTEAFQKLGQEQDESYHQLALYIASEFFLDNPNKDVRILVACCIADVFRICAPEAPYSDPQHIKEIFLFITRQLAGLQDPEGPSFKRYFYLLENLTWVKSFHICLELEENQQIFCELFGTLFKIASEKHSPKTISFMLDLMSPLIQEADSMSQEWLDIILEPIVDEAKKKQSKVTYNLSKDLIKRTANSLEPHVQTFFNTTLMLGKTSETRLGDQLYALIFELNVIAPTTLLSVLPQLEFKLKSSSEKERKDVTDLLARMFALPDSEMAAQNKSLWVCFTGRFNDIDVSVRRVCVAFSQELIVNHPELIPDIQDALRSRQHDPDENVRNDVVFAIVNAAVRDFTHITDELLQCVQERTRDKKLKIRKEALLGLGQIYKQVAMKDDANKQDIERVAWIRNKVLHVYYHTNVEDKILVERILHTSLVPYSFEPEQRMKKLFHLYGNCDQHAVRALQEIFRTQLTLRSIVRSLLELHQRERNDEVNQAMQTKISQLSKNLPDPQKALEYLKKFNVALAEEPRMRTLIGRLVSPDCNCKKAGEYVKETLKNKKITPPIPQNYLYGNAKTLLERIAPVMIDSNAIKALLKILEETIAGTSEMVNEVPDAMDKGMKLLMMLSSVFPGSFQSTEVFDFLTSFVKNDDDTVSDTALQVFTNVGLRLETNFQSVHATLLPILQKMIKIGTPKQAKHAIRCIDKLCKNKDEIFLQVFKHLEKNLHLDSPYFISTLVAVGHISQLCPGQFGTCVRDIVHTFIVKDLLMQDRGQSRMSGDSWYEDRHVSEETNAKMQALKMMVRWLMGQTSHGSKSAMSTLRLLHTMIIHEGDLMERGKINKAEMARLRLQAACCVLKLAQDPCFAELVTNEHFQATALLLNDPCYQVRAKFSQKLHKGLLSLRLPLKYMSIFALAANDPLKERKNEVKQSLITNIHKRREYLRQNPNNKAKLFSLLPDYILPYAIHLLAHDPELKDNDDIDTLKNIRECLWFIMEPLITKNDNYSYSFFRRLIENIKQTKDKQCADDEIANKKMYAVCDLALGLMMTKTANFILKDFPAEPLLPGKLFTDPDQNYSNTKNYLPQELAITQVKAKKSQVPPLTPPSKAEEEKKSSSPSASEMSSPASSPSPKSEGKSFAAIGNKRGKASSKAPPTATSKNKQDKKQTKVCSSREETPPSEASSPSSNTSSQSAKKNQGKITDFVVRSSRKNSRSKSRGEEPPARSRKRSVGSGDELEDTPEKKPTKRGARHTNNKAKSPPAQSPSYDSDESSSTTKSRSRRKRSEPDESPVPAKRSRVARGSRAASPSSTSSKASSPPTPKRGARASKSNNGSSPEKPPTKTRANVRRAGSVQNGTSDGDSGTPDSLKSTPRSNSRAANSSKTTSQKQTKSQPAAVTRSTRRGSKR